MAFGAAGELKVDENGVGGGGVHLKPVVELSTGERLQADNVVIATGAWLPKLARRLGVRTRVQAGRGNRS